MLRRIWQSLKRFFQQLFGVHRRSQTPTPPFLSGVGGDLPPLTDTDYEFLFTQLLEGVHHGWQQARVFKFFADLQPRTDETQWVAWLHRFGERLLALPAPNHELAERMVQLGELECGEFSEVAYKIGMQLLGRDEEPIAEYDQSDDDRPTLLEPEPNLQSVDRTTLVYAEENHQDEAEMWFDRGLQQLMAGDFEGAIASCNEALEIQPDFHIAWGNRGNALNQLGRYEEAIASYDKALKIQPNDHIAWCVRGAALSKLGRYQEAITSYDKALEIQPDFHIASYNRGNALNQLGRYEEAIASYDKALKIQPDYHIAWTGRGNALNQLGRYEEAIASYDKALKIQPDYHIAWDNRGIALSDLGRYEEAIASCDKALKIQPDYHVAWENRGNALSKLGRDEEAIASYDKALEIQPNDHISWHNRGSALSNLGRYEEAIASYDEALEIKPDKHFAWDNRGNALRYLGRYEEALASYDKALKIQPDYHITWDNRGVALKKLGRYEEAIASYDKALKIKPDDHFTWNNRGIAAGNLDKENDLAALIVRSYNPNPELNQRGYNGELASYKEGLKYCLQDTHPEDWGLLHHAIGNAHYFKGRYEENAFKYWRQAVKKYHQALLTLKEDSPYRESHLKVLQSLIRALLDLGEQNEAQKIARQGTSLLQRMLDECQSPGKKKQLEFKFIGFKQLTVDLVVRSGNWCAALEIAEQDKNTCLSWLLDREFDSPKLPEIKQLLNPTTAIIYWHISPYAIQTFILKYNAESPLVLGEILEMPPRAVQTFPSDSDPPKSPLERGTLNEFSPLIKGGWGGSPGLKTPPSSGQQLRKFENLVTEWNEQYGKGKKQESATTNWRDNLPEMLKRLRDEILNIPAIENNLSGIAQLILIPHRDLHRFPLHALFSPNFTITYLPSAQFGRTLLADNSSVTAAAKQPPKLLSVEYPDSKGFDRLSHAEIESGAIAQLFDRPTRFADKDATLDNVISNLEKNYNIFHFTGHGIYNFSQPLQSYLALSGEDKLTLKDILQLPLTRYQLVSLAACETAITGNLTITTEYVGLVSGFMRAGAAYVVSTLWTVESEASAIMMMKFYRLWIEEKIEPVPVAFAETQKWLRQATWGDIKILLETVIKTLPDKAGERIPLKHLINHVSQMEAHLKPFTHPYHWAAFTITGLPGE